MTAQAAGPQLESGMVVKAARRSPHRLRKEQLQASHTPLLKAYAYLLDPSTDPLRPIWKAKSQTIEHWLRRCTGLDATRQNIFGSPSPPLKVLTTDPERVLALARVTLG